MDVSIRQIDSIMAARIRHVGPYEQIGPCFERLGKWAISTGDPISRVFMLSWDNPDFVAPQDLRSDACIAVETETSPPDGITRELIEGGRYAVYVHRGPYTGLRDVYGRLFSEWLPASGERMAERACMEIYLNSPIEVEPEDLVTEVCLPLEDA